MKAVNALYAGYQIQYEDGTIKEIDELTEEEAKIQLARAMDLIENIHSKTNSINTLWMKYIYGK